jgi:hypothetical protein
MAFSKFLLFTFPLFFQVKGKPILLSLIFFYSLSFFNFVSKKPIPFCFLYFRMREMFLLIGQDLTFFLLYPTPLTASLLCALSALPGRVGMSLTSLLCCSEVS